MFASINPNSKWYGVVMISVRKEYWWVGCGGGRWGGGAAARFVEVKIGAENKGNSAGFMFLLPGESNTVRKMRLMVILPS